MNGRLFIPADKPVCAARNGFDIRRILGRIAECPPQLIYRCAQPVLNIDKGSVFPGLLAQLLLGNYFSGKLQQNQHNLERLPRKAKRTPLFRNSPVEESSSKGPKATRAEPTGCVAIRSG